MSSLSSISTSASKGVLPGLSSLLLRAWAASRMPGTHDSVDRARGLDALHRDLRPSAASPRPRGPLRTRALLARRRRLAAPRPNRARPRPVRDDPPFLDGSGRVGRLLATFLPTERGVLHEPVLYLSHDLRQHRQAHDDHLQAVRDAGAWEPWSTWASSRSSPAMPATAASETPPTSRSSTSTWAAWKPEGYPLPSPATSRARGWTSPRLEPVRIGRVRG